VAARPLVNLNHQLLVFFSKSLEFLWGHGGMICETYPITWMPGMASASPVSSQTKSRDCLAWL